MPRPVRNTLILLSLLCVTALALACLLHWRAHRPLSMRLLELRFRCAESLMERWAADPQRHPRCRPWLDKNAQMQRYRDADRALPASAPGRIVLYGDSLTDYWDWRAPATFLPGRPAIDRGIAGQATPELLWRFQQDALNLHPHTLVLLGGTNDIVESGLHLQPSETRQNLARMIELAQLHGIRVVLCSLPPVSYDDPKVQRRFTAAILDLNAWLKSYAATHHLTYVDYFDAMAAPDHTLPDALAADALHPNTAGYRIMQHQLEQGLDSQP